jgi:hypothetical protein
LRADKWSRSLNFSIKTSNKRWLATWYALSIDLSRPPMSPYCKAKTKVSQQYAARGHTYYRRCYSFFHELQPNRCPGSCSE